MEVWNKIWFVRTGAIKFLWNDEVIWDDEADVSVWLTPLEALEKFEKKHPNWRNYIVNSVRFDIVDYHHSIVYFSGQEV